MLHSTMYIIYIYYYYTYSLDIELLLKGLKKDLKNASKKDDTGLIADWSGAIVNHLYWVAASTPQGTRDWSGVVEAKWSSLLNHIANTHSHSNPHYPKCSHPRRKRGDKKKKYIKSSKTIPSKSIFHFF